MSESGPDRSADADAGGSRSRVARLGQFLTFVALLDLLALSIGATFTPPDPVTQALTVGPMLVVSPVLAYWFVYKREPPDGR
ncbi:hypothetical protein Hbl1158_03825 [Halobaculum sp. CBA1158]|uniref:DUF7534 family protein n=1 Tax=Halobaculum sp. CBA1158 TaxID=2904243 RepID=UPI001F409A42|nr:hypothetical protein [Halobaculum sp. CBA1158]UIP00501.1 hypothetical protein Hbl1158_03825 [Halobaculum sp. CBA1158]